MAQQRQDRLSVNSFAIASLIFGIVPSVVLSAIFGVIAVMQIRRGKGSGRGLAIAGLVLSAVWVVVLGTVFLVNRDDVGDTGQSGVTVTELAPENCFNGLTSDDILEHVDVVACSRPHDAKVFAVDNLPPGFAPPVDDIALHARNLCRLHASDYLSRPVDPSLKLVLRYPSADAYARGDHKVVCADRNTSR